MKRKNLSMQFCPECLATDEIAYFRKQWRLALFTFCPHHNLVLHDACPTCGTPIAYYRRDFGKELMDAGSLCECPVCGTDFRNADRIQSSFYSLEIKSIFTDMLASLFSGAKEESRFDLGFFMVLHQLTRIMTMRQNRGRLIAHIMLQAGIEPFIQSPGRITIESRSHAERHQLLEAGLWLLADLEARLARAWRIKAARYNLLIKDFEQKPKWYCEITEKLSDWRSL